MHLRQQGVLRRDDQHADDHHRLQTPPLREGQNGRPHHEPAGQDRCLDGQDDRDGQAGAQQKHQEKHAAPGLGQGLDAIVQVDAVHRAIAEKGHGITVLDEALEDSGPRRGRAGGAAVPLGNVPSHRVDPLVGQSP